MLRQISTSLEYGSLDMALGRLNIQCSQLQTEGAAVGLDSHFFVMQFIVVSWIQSKELEHKEKHQRFARYSWFFVVFRN